VSASRTRRRAALLLAGGLALAVPSSGQAQQPPRLRDRVHDLVSLMDRAQPSEFSAHATSPVAAVSTHDPRPGVAFIQTRPQRSIVFEDLFTDGETTLRFGAGLARPALALEDAPVRFLVDVASERDPTWRRVFDHTWRPSELPPDTGLVQHELRLPGRGPLKRSVRFSALPGDQSGRAASWSGWSCPQLLSSGRELSLADDPLRVPGAGLDLLAIRSEARMGGGVDARLRPMDPAPGVELVGGSRASLRLAAPARLSWQVDVPEQAELIALLGVDGPTSWHLGGGELELAIQINDRPVHLRRLDAAKRQHDRGWKQLRFDLSPWAGRRVELSLAVGSGQQRGPDVLAVARLLLSDGSGRPRLPIDAAPTVIVLLADTLRQDALGPGTPNLQALADAGVRFSAARATSSWTWPSTASLLTGLDPGRHGLLDNARPVMSPDATTLAQLLAQRGYSTGAFVANALISRSSGLARGFETFVSVPNARAGTLNARVEAWLSETSGSARLLYLHYMDPHAPYQPSAALDDPDQPLLPPHAGDAAMGAALTLGLEHPETRAWATRLRSAYASEVAELDQAIGQLFVSLRAHGALDDALVVFVSDHGEEFLEHGRTSHGWHLFDETLAVPLTLTGFGPSAQALPPRVHRAPVSTRDLLPSLCRLLELAPPPGCAPPWPLGEEAQPRPVFAHTALARTTEREHVFDLASVVSAGHKLLLTPDTGQSQLFDLEHDPGELTDLAAQQPERVADMVSLLRAWLQTTSEGPANAADAADVDEAQRLLRELGYLGDDERR